mgnify:CR=1 FL=1
MGSWGLGTFEDDIACDWLEDLHDSDPIAFFVQCLDLSDLQYVQFLACVGVVCTAEIIHALLCEPRNGLPESAHQWLGAHQGLHVLPLIPDTIAGLRRVMGPDSEMRELWEDNQELYEDWMIQISDLLKRLESALTGNH